MTIDGTAARSSNTDTPWHTLEKGDSEHGSNDGRPALPLNDNVAGAPEKLLIANRYWRQRLWPSPFDCVGHTVRVGDARDLSSLSDSSVNLVVTSPPYFTLKPYNSACGGKQLGRIADYDRFLEELDRAWC